TSGAPKAVVLTEPAIKARIALNHAHIPEAERGRTLCLLPLHFGHGLIGNLLTPWLGGGDVVLWPQPSLAELAGLGPAIDAHGIDFLSSVPSLWQILRRLDAPRPTRALRRVHIGSAPLPPDLRPWVSAWAGTENVWDMYGMTEAGNWISGSATGGLGAPWGGEVAVLTDEGIAPAGLGEILIRSPALMRGYWERPDLTRAVFEGDWFRTGDLGRVEAGEITLTGRRSAQINRAGVKIQPEEIEALALACPGVETACCFAYPEPVAGEGAGLAITGPATPAEAQAFLRARLMAERLPDKWIKLDRLPVTDRGKPDRRALAALI
ncbi:MAG: fatty acid--CoA ligase family protein, partial [Pseudomonadota bacterium]